MMYTTASMRRADRKADGIERFSRPGTDGSSGSLGRGLRAHAVAAYGAITSRSSRLLDGSTQPYTRRSRAVTWNGQPRERGLDRQTGLEHDNGAQTPWSLSHLSRFAGFARPGAQLSSIDLLLGFSSIVELIGEFQVRWRWPPAPPARRCAPALGEPARPIGWHAAPHRRPVQQWERGRGFRPAQASVPF